MKTTKVKAEVHTHSIASFHAYSTIGEMINMAEQKGLELLAVTDHGPSYPDSPHTWYFENLKAIPRKVNSIYFLRGAEANLISYDGTVDIPQEILAKLDWVIASIHVPFLEPGSIKDHTDTYINALKNPMIDALGHSGTPSFPYDIDSVLETAKKLDKVIELNNHSFIARKANIENCKKIARRCAELGVNVVLTTDAHSAFEIGETDECWKMAMEAGIREEQILNISAERFLSYICRRRGYDRSIFENTKSEG
ncbi:MAG: phosphatase [Clostridia bacterium]|nr:phosphatase [Clostridia bacterium]